MLLYLYTGSLLIYIYMRSVYFRFIQWKSYLVRRSKRWRGVRDDREQLEAIEFQPGTNYKSYYIQEDSDTGILMETNLATKEVSAATSGALTLLRVYW